MHETRGLTEINICFYNKKDLILKDILKIDNELISRPLVYNKNMYLIKDDSIIKLN